MLLRPLATGYGQDPQFSTHAYASPSSPDIVEMWKRGSGHRFMLRPARSISRALRGVHDIAQGLRALCLGWLEGRGARCPCPDECARDESAPHIASVHGEATLPQTGSSARDTPP